MTDHSENDDDYVLNVDDGDDNEDDNQDDVDVPYGINDDDDNIVVHDDDACYNTYGYCGT